MEHLCICSVVLHYVQVTGTESSYIRNAKLCILSNIMAFLCVAVLFVFPKIRERKILD